VTTALVEAFAEQKMTIFMMPEQVAELTDEAVKLRRIAEI
jgi:ribosomal protein S15P/S13E